MALGYVYKFHNEFDEVIYVGYTRDIKKRMSQHFGNARHLSQECYSSVTSIHYAEFETVNEAKIYEIYYISKINPKYNTEFISGGFVSIELPHVEFKEYNIVSKYIPKTAEKYNEFQSLVEDVFDKINLSLTVLDVSKPSSEFILAYSKKTACDRIEANARSIEAVSREIKKELRRIKNHLGYESEVA